LYSDVDAQTGWHFRHRSHVHDRATEIATRLGVVSRLQAPLSQLSGGERQKIELARTFSLPRQLLLLDEPMSALDVDAVHEVDQLIAEAADAGATVVVATHDLHSATRTDQVVLCRAGGVVVGRPDEVLSESVLAGAALEHFRWSVH
jgi:ABC-type Mn2+/Zn2+ transport system ATPase subunit